MIFVYELEPELKDWCWEYLTCRVPPGDLLYAAYKYFVDSDMYFLDDLYEMHHTAEFHYRLSNWVDAAFLLWHHRIEELRQRYREQLIHLPYRPADRTYALVFSGE